MTDRFGQNECSAHLTLEQRYEKRTNGHSRRQMQDHSPYFGLLCCPVFLRTMRGWVHSAVLKVGGLLAMLSVSLQLQGLVVEMRDGFARAVAALDEVQHGDRLLQEKVDSNKAQHEQQLADVVNMVLSLKVSSPRPVQCRPAHCHHSAPPSTQAFAGDGSLSALGLLASGTQFVYAAR